MNRESLHYLVLKVLKEKVAKKASKKCGDNSWEATPVPISNTEVKLPNADDTWWVTARESKKLPL